MHDGSYVKMSLFFCTCGSTLPSMIDLGSESMLNDKSRKNLLLSSSPLVFTIGIVARTNFSYFPVEYCSLPNFISKSSRVVARITARIAYCDVSSFVIKGMVACRYEVAMKLPILFVMPANLIDSSSSIICLQRSETLCSNNVYAYL
jgi:hypothetical protein